MYTYVEILQHAIHSCTYDEQFWPYRAELAPKSRVLPTLDTLFKDSA